MLLKNLILSLRYFSKNRANFVLIFTELIIGLLCFILVFNYLNYEFSYDKHLKNSDKIFRVITKYRFSPTNEINTIFSSPIIAPIMHNSVPEIVQYTRVYPTNQMVEVDNQKNIEYNVFWADSTFFKVFQFEFISGCSKTALSRPKSVVITESISKKYFKDENPIGKSIRIGVDNCDDYTVTGVIRNIKSNTHLKFDFILSNQTIKLFESLSPGDLKVLTYVLLNENESSRSVESKFSKIIDSWGIPNMDSEKYNLTLQVITNIHLGAKKQNEIANTGNSKQLLFTGIASVLILILAFLNYINLMALNGENRAKEFCLRKVHGANRRNIFSMFLMDSNIFVIAAVLLTSLLLYFLFPAFKNFTGRELYLSFSFYLITILIIILLIGNVSVLFPAVTLSKLNPSVVLKGIFRNSKQGLLYRRIIMIIQFAITIVVAVCSVVILQQMHFIRNEDHGYRKENIYITRMVMNAGENSHNIKCNSIKQELLRHNGIDKVSCCDALPELGGFSRKIFRLNGEESTKIPVYGFEADYDYINTLGIELLEGRNFSETYLTDASKIIINKAAAKEFGFENSVGEKIIDIAANKELTIIGVIDDYNFRSLYYDIEPLVIGLKDKDFNFIALKTKKGIKNGSEILKNVILKFDPDFQYSPIVLADRWEMEYKKDKMLSQGFNFLLIIIFLIMGIGLYAFSNYIAKKWQKGISIRKVLGASKLSILVLYLREYLLLMIVSMVIGICLSRYLIQFWLQNFAVKINLTLVHFIIPAVIISVLTIIIMMISILKSINTNPVDFLSNE